MNILTLLCVMQELSMNIPDDDLDPTNIGLTDEEQTDATDETQTTDPLYQQVTFPIEGRMDGILQSYVSSSGCANHCVIALTADPYF